MLVINLTVVVLVKSMVAISRFLISNISKRFLILIIPQQIPDLKYNIAKNV